MPIRQYFVKCRNCGNSRLRSNHHSFLCSACKTTRQAFTRTYYANKKKALVRDSSRCQACGAKKRLVAHHLDCNRQNNSVSNLITLCTTCHTTLHKLFTNDTLKQSIIYNLFPDRFRWAKTGKRAIWKVEPPPQVKPKLMFHPHHS